MSEAIAVEVSHSMNVSVILKTKLSIKKSCQTITYVSTTYVSVHRITFS